MTYQRNRNRITYLSKEYNETHLNSQELVSSKFKSDTNKKYYDREQIKIVDDVLYTISSFTANLLKEQVYYIVKHFRLKELCSRCKTEVIVACIVIFVWKGFNKRLIIDDNRLWREYGLSWEVYGRVMDNLLRKTRENML